MTCCFSSIKVFRFWAYDDRIRHGWWSSMALVSLGVPLCIPWCSHAMATCVSVQLVVITRRVYLSQLLPGVGNLCICLVVLLLKYYNKPPISLTESPPSGGLDTARYWTRHPQNTASILVHHNGSNTMQYNPFWNDESSISCLETVSCVTVVDDVGSSTVKYGLAADKLDLAAEGTHTRYTYYNYTFGYILLGP